MSKSKLKYGSNSGSSTLGIKELIYDMVVGIVWNEEESTPTLTRIDGAKNIIEYTSDVFDNHVIWGNIKRCNVSDTGTVNAYYGDTTFAYDGSNGQVMVEIPKFYYKSEKVGDNIYWWVSPYKLPKFKVHPAFVSKNHEIDYFYVGAFEASMYDITANATEVNTIQITAEPTADGNITIKLDATYTCTVAILDTDTIEGVVDKIVAAGNQTDYQGVIWTVAKVDADELTYTASENGLKSTATFSGGTTGVTATVTKTNAGAGGYVKGDSSGNDTGDKLCSVAGVKPASGMSNTCYLSTFRTYAQNRGAGWEQIIFTQVSAIQLLFFIEYASLYSRSVLGPGIISITDDGSTNMAINTGYTAGIGTNGVDLGNTSGQCALVTHYKTGQSSPPITYRGMENLWGNIWTRVDGINIKGNYNPWIANHGFQSLLFAYPYVDTGKTDIGPGDGWARNISYGSGFDYGFIPNEISGGAGASTYLCVAYYRNTGNREMAWGGAWTEGTHCGINFFNTSYAYTSSGRTVGSRLSYIPMGNSNCDVDTTITAGNTYVDVTHSLASTPTKVRVTPTTNLGTRSFWVDTKGAATFRININSSDVIDHTFDWEAEV